MTAIIAIGARGVFAWDRHYKKQAKLPLGRLPDLFAFFACCAMSVAGCSEPTPEPPVAQPAPAPAVQHATEPKVVRPIPSEEPQMSGDGNGSILGLSEDELSRRWRQESERYVSAVNEFVRRGMREGWDDLEEPKDTRLPMAEAVLNAVRRANELGRVDDLRERFPPAHSPFIRMLEENGQSLPVAILLDDGRIIMRVGAPFEKGHVVVVDGQVIENLPSEVISVGSSPNRKFFAVARHSGVTIHEGWDGPVVQVLKWPKGNEGVPQSFEVELIQGTPTITQLTPFDTGDRALLVSPEGIFVLSSAGAIRLLPTEDQVREHLEWLQKRYPGESLSEEMQSFLDLSMEHAAISPDGKIIAAGAQEGPHYLFDADSLKIIGEVGPLTEYPHYAAFSATGKMVALNSCQLYDGMTIGVPTDLLPGLKTDTYERDEELNKKLDERLILLEKGSRVYAAVSRKDEFIVGNAYGYLRAFDVAGDFRWQHFIGSTICDIHISRDGKRLVVTTFAGFLSVIDLDTGEADPFIIGTSTHRERRRWLFWKGEEKPLAW